MAAEFWVKTSQFSSRFAKKNLVVIVTFIGVLFSYNLLFFRIDCLTVGLDLQESLNFVTNNSLTGIFHTENGGGGEAWFR